MISIIMKSKMEKTSIKKVNKLLYFFKNDLRYPLLNLTSPSRQRKQWNQCY